MQNKNTNSNKNQGKKGNIASRVRTAVEEIITNLGYTVWDVDFYKEGADHILEISIDKKGGISLDDCSRVTKEIDPIIDELDPVEDAYSLMVSSAGSERDIRTQSHYDCVINGDYPVVVKLFSALDGRKEFNGKLGSIDNDFAVIKTESGESISIPRKLIAKIRGTFDLPKLPEE